MTIEEAIRILKNECYVFNPLNFDRTTLINTALDTVIKALEKKSCEVCIESEKAYKYDILVTNLFNKSYLSWYSGKLGIDSYAFSGIMEALEPVLYACKLKNFKVSEKETKK